MALLDFPHILKEKNQDGNECEWKKHLSGNVLLVYPGRIVPFVKSLRADAKFGKLEPISGKKQMETLVNFGNIITEDKILKAVDT